MRTKKEFALLYLDVDNFKQVNDTLGHAIGDQLLTLVATKIKKATRNIDFIARLGGDEFVVLIEDVEKPKHVARVATRIIDEFKDYFIIDHHEITTSISIGIALYIPGESDENSLMKQADIAMYSSKDAGKNTYHFFSSELNEKHNKQSPH